jgi:hypothetical protein
MESRNMSTGLSLRQLAQIIERNPTALAAAASMPRITIDDVAFAISRMAIDADVARDLVATSTGRPIEDVGRGFMTSIQAAAIAAHTIAAHPRQDIAAVFIAAVAPGFGTETGSLQ